MEWIWFKMLGSLALIVGLIVGTLWLLKKFMAFSKPAAGAGVAMEVAGVLHLGPRRSVYAVKAGGQVILLGVAEHAITYLTQLDRTSAAGIADAAPAPLGEAAPFFGLLSRQFTRTVRSDEEFAPEGADGPAATGKKTKSSAASRKKAVKPS